LLKKIRRTSSEGSEERANNMLVAEDPRKVGSCLMYCFCSPWLLLVTRRNYLYFTTTLKRILEP